MIKRIFWLGLGVTVGVIAARKLGQAQQSIGPAGLNRAVGRINDDLHNFADAVWDGMNRRETELRSALGLDDEN
ncbi:hypothetical protein FHU41_000546 [Psychromicrobium silvestre]|uniref:Uncharacterized protein n=1 Tax=Psychromicrobium silvestre TaxID=1645614 RepID=A0A7Y9S554_9MICC|nr:hypothetical protein [Psychromicrobium silvestre]NYE94325.1 hypothetical protein [Psychromicrobium silvestre]